MIEKFGPQVFENPEAADEESNDDPFAAPQIAMTSGAQFFKNPDEGVYDYLGLSTLFVDPLGVEPPE
jgi:hypothetical protein